MVIQKFQPDQEGIIRINNCMRLLTMGLQDDIITIWGVIDNINKSGIPMNFFVRADGDMINSTEAQEYLNSFISDTNVWHLFAEKPKIQSVNTPSSKILT